MTFCPSQQRALPSGLPGPGLDTSFLPSRMLPLAGEMPCLWQVTFIMLLSVSKSRTSDPALNVLVLRTRATEKPTEVKSVTSYPCRGEKKVPVETKALSLSGWPGCWANTDVKKLHEWGFFSDFSRTFVVFILQKKQKDMPQTKKITSVASIPRGLFCFSSGRQEAFSPEAEGG